MAGPRTRQKLQPRSTGAILNSIQNRQDTEQRRWEGSGGEGPYPVFNQPNPGDRRHSLDTMSPGWLQASSGRDNSGIMMADSGDIMNKYKQFTDKFGDFDIGGDGIEYKKDFGIPWGGTGTIEGYGGGDDYGGGINFSWPLGQTSALGTGLGGLDEYQTAELGLPQPMDWQNDRLTLDELINLGASEEQIAKYLGVV